MTTTSSAPQSSSSHDRFNDEAAAWESNPAVHTASTLAFEAILEHFPAFRSYKDGNSNDAGLSVLEIGCGTGLLSFMVAPFVHSLTAVDSAAGMIAGLKLKLERQPAVKNILPVNAMLDDPDDIRLRLDPTAAAKAEELPPRRFDLVLSNLVLHHIPSLEDVAATMFGCLKPGGSVALTDFEDFGPQARRFHPEAKMGGVERHGISRRVIEKVLKDAGFVDVRIEMAFEMEKKVERVPGKGLGDENNEMMTFPFLICIGKKPQ